MIIGKNLTRSDAENRKTGPLSRLVVATLLGSATVIAAAQDNSGVGISVGDSKIYPSVRVDYLHNDNAYLTDGDEVDASSVNVAPSATWYADRGSVNVQASYSGNYSKSSESALDFDDHSLGLSSAAVFGKRLSGTIELGVSQGHEELGTDITRIDAESYDEQIVYRDTSLLTRLRYGAQAAKGNVELALLVSDHKPTTLKELSAYTEYSLVRPSVLFSFRVSSDTRLVLETRFGQYDYKTGDRDRDELDLLTGLNFAATGKLRGSFRIGVSRSSYDNPNIEDDDELYLDGSLVYLPRDHSRISLRVGRDFDNNAQSDFNATEDTVQLNWQYDWSDRFSHVLSAGRNSKSRECPDLGETTTYVGLEGNVNVRRWLSVGAGIYQRSRDGDSCEGITDASDSLDYDRQILGLHIRATL